MRLLEIELRAWRGLNQTLAVLSPRLNLILGPNESGKSRIFQALHFGLFESHKGTALRKQALQSWASQDAPFVRIAFCAAGIEYELQKQFLKGATAQLSGGGRTLRGEAAEESLRQILGSRPGGSRGAEVDDLGIWPLLMVSQGDSRRPVQDHLNEDGRGRLQERLSQEIGVAAISAAGQQVMSLAEQEYGQYFTATGLEGRTLRDARAEVRTAEDGLAAATAALQHQEETAQALASNRQELVELEARHQRAKHEADAARDRAEAAQAAGRLVAIAQGALDTHVQKATSARNALYARQKADANFERLTSDLARFELELTQRAGLQNELERSVRTAERQRGEAVKREKEARAAMQRQHQQRREEHLVDDVTLDGLKILDQNARAAAAKLQGAAVSVVVHLRQDAVVDGVRRTAGEAIEIHVIENRRIPLGEVADVEIRPGGGELERLREAAAAADEELKSALLATGAQSLAHAVKMHAERTTELYAAMGTAEAALVQMTGERDSAVEALRGFQNEMTALRTRIETLRDESQQFLILYAQQPTAAQLQEAIEEAVAEREASTRDLAEAKREFVDLGGSQIQADARRLGIAVEGLAGQVREVRSTGDQFQGELRTLMLGAHYESKEEAGAKVEQARNSLTRLLRQAAAARRLWDVLSAERRRVVEKLTAPVSLRVRPYLQELFPGSMLDAGEGLDVLGLQSDQLNEPFADLSGGAQEQLSLLTRIGLAEVLAGNEGTLPLILDDALINTDPERVRCIQRLLFRAADNLQIILFSCHDVLYDGLGAEFVRHLDRRRH